MIEEPQDTINRLRRLLWLNHGCPLGDLYGDDGEMQCGGCGVDFKRNPARTIEAIWTRRAADTPKEEVKKVTSREAIPLIWRRGEDCSDHQVLTVLERSIKESGIGAGLGNPRGFKIWVTVEKIKE